MPVVHAPTASLPDAASTEADASRSYTLALAAGLLSLAAVVIGFALVALSILDVIAVPIGWGGGLCLAGWAVASLRRDRASRISH